MEDDRILTAASVVLRVCIWINALLIVAFVSGIIVSVVFADRLTAHLAIKYPTGDIGATIDILRATGVLAVVAGIAVYYVFAPLRSIVGTVRAGDPFIAANADRLRRIGWALLVLQVLDLAIGGITIRLGRLGVDHAGWSPALTGWIVVLMMFVLARVFRVGAAMRDDLAMTV